MRVRPALVALSLTMPLLALSGGVASAEPYLPVGAPVPATGVYAPDGAVAEPVVRAVVTRAAVKRPVKRLASRR